MSWPICCLVMCDYQLELCWIRKGLYPKTIARLPHPALAERRVQNPVYTAKAPGIPYTIKRVSHALRKTFKSGKQKGESFTGLNSIPFALPYVLLRLPEDEKPKRNHVVKTILCVQPFNCLTTIPMEICAGISRPSLLLLSLPRSPPRVFQVSTVRVET